MIWVIANKAEEDGSFPTYQYYKKAFADDEISIYCADASDRFDFLAKDDIVLMRTRDQRINENARVAQNKIGFKSTIESEYTDMLTHDKEVVKPLLEEIGMCYPKSVSISDIEEGRKYFVKPRYGENSQGIDVKSVCTTKQEVIDKCKELICGGTMPMIEQFVEGYDVTTAIFWLQKSGEFKVYSSLMKANSKEGYHTNVTKSGFNFIPRQIEDKLIEYDAKNIFKAIGASHYLRIDSRLCGGLPYILDINMIAGLAPNGYMSKCMEVNGIDYLDTVRMVIESAN